MKIIEIKTGQREKSHLHQGAAYALLAKENRQQLEDILGAPECLALDENHTRYTEKNNNSNRDPKRFIPVSRVLEIVKNFTYPSTDKADFGTFIHACTAITDRNQFHNNPEILDIDAIEQMENGPEILGYLAQWEKFKQDEGVSGRMLIECPLSSCRGFAGTPDRILLDSPLDEVVFVYLSENGYSIKRYAFDGMGIGFAENEFLSYLAAARAKIGGF